MYDIDLFPFGRLIIVGWGKSSFNKPCTNCNINYCFLSLSCITTSILKFTYNIYNYFKFTFVHQQSFNNVFFLQLKLLKWMLYPVFTYLYFSLHKLWITSDGFCLVVALELNENLLNSIVCYIAQSRVPSVPAEGPYLIGGCLVEWSWSCSARYSGQVYQQNASPRYLIYHIQ